MGRPRPVEFGLLFSGFIYSNAAFFKKALDESVRLWGDVLLASEQFNFSNFTDYYAPEMGGPLYRRFVLFALPAPSEYLRLAKQDSNRIEEMFSTEGRRAVNIDPGWLGASRIILASTKDFSHRVGLGSGIFAEVTMIYNKKRGWVELPWTYPDFRSQEYKDWFNKARSAVEEYRCRRDKFEGVP